MNNHKFAGQWITNRLFSDIEIKNVYHRQLDGGNSNEIPPYANSHILFRKKFSVDRDFNKAVIFITADDYYKLYINGTFVAQGPTPAYPFHYNYNEIDISKFLKKGENTIAVHTYYQGLINRVWVSGDNRHGLLLDIDLDGENVAASDESFLQTTHGGYETGEHISGYFTQFSEIYDASAFEVGFEKPDFNDTDWENAVLSKTADHTLFPQPTAQLVFERIKPEIISKNGDKIFIDFASCYVGYLNFTAKGSLGDSITIRYGHELNDDGSVNFKLRCNCVYEDKMLLSGKEDSLNIFDYKPFRYVELTVPNSCEIDNIFMTARHYPYNQVASLKPEYKAEPLLCHIWDLCINTIKYGVQEVIQDCMDREKGFYVGDGCYTSLNHMILTGDDSIVRYLIDSSKQSQAFNPSTVTCLNCSFMQEIAEFPLILVSLMLWQYRYTGDLEYLKENFEFAKTIVDTYKQDYEKDYLLQNLDKWCVVEWPMNYRDGYDVDITEGKVCETPHIVINAYYIKAIQALNTMAGITKDAPYRDLTPLKEKFWDSFYDEKRHIFTDSPITSHSSYISNMFAYGFDLCPDEKCEETILNMIKEKKISSAMFFATFPLLCSFAKENQEMLKEMLKDEGAWARMLREGATTTFEGWGKDTKWNTSLFHMTFSYASIFLADIDLKRLFS